MSYWFSWEWGPSAHAWEGPSTMVLTSQPFDGFTLTSLPLISTTLAVLSRRCPGGTITCTPQPSKRPCLSSFCLCSAPVCSSGGSEGGDRGSSSSDRSCCSSARAASTNKTLACAAFY